MILGVVEIILRTYVPPPDYRGLYIKTHDPRKYTMKPNVSLVRQAVQVDINSDGYRDSEFIQPKQGSQRVIAMLGDSFTFGQGVPQDEASPAILQKLLNSKMRADKFRVWNLGVSGYNTVQESYVLKSFVLEKQPAWVILGYNMNDYEPINVPPVENTRSRTEESRYPKWIRDIAEGDIHVVKLLFHKGGVMIRKFRPQWFHSSYVEDVLKQYTGSGDGWKEVSGLIAEMNRLCQERGIGFTVALLPAMFDFSHHPFARAHEVVADFCKSNGIDFIDVTSDFADEEVKGMVVSILDPHPNPKAQRIFAEALARHLLPRLQEKTTGELNN